MRRTTCAMQKWCHIMHLSETSVVVSILCCWLKAVENSNLQSEITTQMCLLMARYSFKQIELYLTVNFQCGFLEKNIGHYKIFCIFLYNTIYLRSPYKIRKYSRFIFLTLSFLLTSAIRTSAFISPVFTRKMASAFPTVMSIDLYYELYSI